MSIVSLYHHEMIGVIRFDWFLYPQYYGVRLVLSPQCYDLIGFVPFYTPSIVIRLVWFLCPQFDFTSEKSLPRLCTPLWLLPQLLHLCQVNGEGDLRIPFWSGQKIWYLTCVSVFMCIHIYIYISLHVYVYMYGSSVPYFACVICIPMHAHFMNIQKAPSKSQTFIPNSSHLDLLRSSFLPMLWHVIKWQVQWFSERLKSYPLVLFHIAREFHFPFVDHF